MSEQEQSDDSADIRESLGSQLRAAREEKSLSIEQVASQLMLDRHVIAGLEAGDYSGLPETTFVRGYLQAYLRLLGKPESLLGKFDQINSQDYPVMLNRSSVSRVACSDDGWVRCISVGLVILLFVATGLWFAEQSFHVFDSLQPELQTMLSDDDSRPTAGEPASSGNSMAPAPGSDIDPGLDSNMDSNMGSNVEDVAEKKTGIESDIPADKQPDVLAVAIPGEVAEAEDNADKTVSASAQTPAQPAGDKANELILRFTGSSWIRVVDATGTKLVAGTYHDEQEVILHGQLPYSIILGSAGYVKMWFRGAAVEKSYKPGKVARLTLGEQGQ